MEGVLRIQGSFFDCFRNVIRKGKTIYKICQKALHFSEITDIV